MEEVSPSPFGTLLRRYRTEAGLTQSELAERAGISTDAVSTLERGVRRSPHRDTVRLLTKALELPPHDRTLFEEAAVTATTTSAGSLRVLSEPPTGNFLGAAPPAGPLVAREEELERIRSILDAVADGGGQVLLLAGELGVGKTRLAQEAMVEAGSRGFVVGAGRCYRAERDTPYYPVLEALAGMTAGAPLGVRADIARREQEIERLVSAGGAPSSGPNGSQEDQRRLVAAVTDVLAALATVLPIALFLDDLHWADRSTVKLLLHLARTTHGGRVLLLGTFRDVRLSEEHSALAEALQDLSRERLVERITVRRLSAEETAGLITATMGKVSEEFADFVHRRTKGNPRFIEQLMQSLGGRLQLVREIGAGAMGRVFEARDSQIGKTVAAKLMVARGGVDPDSLLRFQQEGAVLAALTHPNIVHIYGTFTEEHASCILMELVEGRALGQILRAGPLPLPRARAIVLQVAAALEYAHGHAIAHRDIKPDNIMVTGDDQVKVTDFGIARIVQPDVTMQTIATTGMRMGTPLYMAPEQIEGKKVDGRADMYSFGAVIYHMVTGRPPFEGDDPLTIAIKQLQEVPQPPSEVNPDLPEGWDEVILKALAKDPAQRFQRAAELKTAVEALSVEPARRPTVAGRDGRTAQSRKTRAGFAVLVVGALVSALVIAAVLLRGQPSGARVSHTAVACVPAIINTGGLLYNLPYAGLQRAVSKLHLKKPLVYSVPSSHDGFAQMSLAAQHHPCLVVVGANVATNSLAANALTAVAERYPTVHFALVDAFTLNSANFVNRPNVENLVMRRQDSGYLVGYLAGLMEKLKVGKATHGVIGVMGGVPEPGVTTYIDGYQQGAHAAYPRIKNILVDYANTFVDKKVGREIALSQIKHGADILFGVAGDAGLGYMAAARKHGVYAIGVDVDQSSLGQYVLTSALIRVDNAVYKAVTEAAQHHFAGGIHTFGLAENGAGFGKPSKIVPAAILKRVEVVAGRIARKEIIVGS